MKQYAADDPLMVDQGGIRALTRANLEKYNALPGAFPQVEYWGEWVILDPNLYGAGLARAEWREPGIFFT